MIKLIILILSGFLAGLIASISTTIKDKDFSKFEERPNYFLSLFITFGLYSTFGILILFFLIYFKVSLLNSILPILISAIIYFGVNKLFIKQSLLIKLPRILDLILFFWPILLYYILCYILISDYLLFDNQFLINYKLYYSLILTTLSFFLILILKR